MIYNINIMIGLFIVLLAIFIIVLISNLKKEKGNRLWLPVVAIGIFVVFSGVLAFVYAAQDNGQTTDPQRSYDNGYTITGYDVDMNVNDKNEITIHEEITVLFKEARHGIYRALPTVSRVKYEEDGKVINKNYAMDYSLDSATQLYDSYEEDGYYFIQMGNESVYKQVGDVQTYTIKYKAFLGDDRITTYDQFYYNVIGGQWSTDISNVNVTVTFPTNFEGQVFYIYNGSNHSEQTVDGNVFTYTNSGTLDYGTSVTIRTLLPQGYFNTTKNIYPSLISFILCFIAAIIMLIMFKKFHNKKEITPIVEFELPDINPTEAGGAFDGKVQNKDLSALFVYWADKGYVNIVEEDGKTYLEPIKMSNTGMQEYEKKIYVKLFNRYERIAISKVGTTAMEPLNAAKNIVDGRQKHEYFNQPSIVATYVTIALASLMLIISQIAVNIVLRIDLAFIVAVGFGLLGGAMLLLMKMLKDFQNFGFSKNKIWTITWIVLALAFCVMYGWYNFDLYVDFMFARILTPLVFLLAAFLVAKINVRTDKGIEIQNRLLGLKNFIEYAEKDRIKMLAKEQPEMFYHVLPYALVLGVSDVWIKQFADIDIPTPDWYISDSPFTTHMICTTIISSTNSIGNSYRAAVVSDMANRMSEGGGDFGGGGGGFSGGGFGGGGGGSW